MIDDDGRPTLCQRPRPCWNVLSAIAPFLGIGGAIVAYCLGQYFFHQHPAHLKTAAMTFGAFLLFGFISACIALVRSERLWGITALGIAINAPFAFIAWAAPWDWPF
jgi:hypothetical protein